MSEKKDVLDYAQETIDVLNSILGIYSRLLSAENTKRTILLAREAPKLQQIVTKQEDLLKESRHLEALLDLHLSNFSQHLGVTKLGLQQISKIKKIPSNLRDIMNRKRMELYEIVVSLKAVASANEAILQDNLTLFHSLAQTLSREVETNHPAEKRFSNSRRSIFINAAG